MTGRLVRMPTGAYGAFAAFSHFRISPVAFQLRQALQPEDPVQLVDLMLHADGGKSPQAVLHG